MGLTTCPLSPLDPSLPRLAGRRVTAAGPSLQQAVARNTRPPPPRRRGKLPGPAATQGQSEPRPSIHTLPRRKRRRQRELGPHRDRQPPRMKSRTKSGERAQLRFPLSSALYLPSVSWHTFIRLYDYTFTRHGREVRKPDTLFRHGLAARSSDGWDRMAAIGAFPGWSAEVDAALGGSAGKAASQRQDTWRRGNLRAENGRRRADFRGLGSSGARDGRRPEFPPKTFSRNRCGNGAVPL